MIDAQGWVAAVSAARDDGHVFFDLLTAVDAGEAFEVVVHLWHPEARTHKLLTTSCPREAAVVPSLTGLFKGAAWHERAVADLFGITFAGHDTEPLLLSSSFTGHPLRKDFVLAARVAKRWPGAKEPGESDADLAGDPTARPRRRPQPPGVPREWGSA